jgi:Domain of unknown function (DUF4221)
MYLYRYKFSYLLPFFLCLSGCNKLFENKNTEQNFSDTVILTVFKDKSFQLDSITAPTFPCLQFIPQTNQLLFLNNYDNSIYYYDYLTEKLSMKKSFSLEGPQGVGRISGFYQQHNDSLLLYAYQQHYLTKVFNNTFKRIITYDNEFLDFTKNNIVYPTPFVSTIAPINVSNKDIFLTGFIMGEGKNIYEFKRPTLIRIDSTDKLSYHLNYPDFYKKGNWDGFRFVYNCFNSEKQTICVSYAADHFIHQYSIIDKQESSFYAGSRYIKSIRSVNKPIGDEDTKIVFSNLMTTNCYHGLLYDSWRKVYYRIATLAMSQDSFEHEMKKPKGNFHHDITIIILNEKFKIIGETILSSKTPYSFDHVFVSQEGLCLKKESDDEKEIKFTIFKLEKK